MNPFQRWNLPGEVDIDFLDDQVVYKCDICTMYSIDELLAYASQIILHTKQC